ncbi:MAG: hypothetical protein LBP53_00565 [Candidatus Peribacteria bacterium]|jgi:methionyl-tRNA formyltransferase|nr:hypothetical protein [Candidatus Peribacteria bacterium]
MHTSEQEQLFKLLQNIEENKKLIPTFTDLTRHPVFGANFASMSEKEQAEVKEVIEEYIEKKIYTLNKTKGGQLFIRFFEAKNALFWQFRALNENDTTAQTGEFQEIGKQVEHELFKLEGILTEKMLNQEKGLDKVVDSFYNIVYLFFPRYNAIE